MADSTRSAHKSAANATDTKRCDLFTLEFPIFALSKKLNTDIVKSEHIVVSPNPLYGQPNMYDKETLIYVCSKLIQAQNNGVSLSNKIRFTGYDFLKFTGKLDSGRSYIKLKESLNRISSTFVSTIKNGDVATTKGYTLFWFEMVEYQDKSTIELTLHDSLITALRENKALKLDSHYLDLAPLERRLYEVALKHCGKQSRWSIGLESLQDKVGSTQTPRHFKAELMKIIKADSLNSYHIGYDKLRDVVSFRPKQRRTVGSS